MRKCPLCDGEANSPHHIRPRSEGGTDEPRNIVWLCSSCHDRVEGIPFTPDLIESERRKIKGYGPTSGETYVFMDHGDYMVFAGIRVNGNVIPFNILLPHEQPLNDAQISMDIEGQAPQEPEKAGTKVRAGGRMGRPRKTIPLYLAQILDEDLSIREKAKLIGVSHTTIRRYIKERRAEYVAC